MTGLKVQWVGLGCGHAFGIANKFLAGPTGVVCESHAGVWPISITERVFYFCTKKGTA